jgi:hypothetical protein
VAYAKSSGFLADNEGVKPDLYTKIVLSIIAAALVLNLLSPVLQPTIVKAKTSDPLDQIADKIDDISSTLDSIESYGLRIRGRDTTEVPVKLKE